MTDLPPNGPAQAAPEKPAPEPLTAFAARHIRKRHRALLAEAQGLRREPWTERHRVRKDAKRLRYLAEHFGSLFPRKALREYVRELAGAQDALGALIDSAVALRLVENLQPGKSVLIFLRGWLAAHDRIHLARAERALRRLEKSPRFWKQ